MHMYKVVNKKQRTWCGKSQVCLCVCVMYVVYVVYVVYWCGGGMPSVRSKAEVQCFDVERQAEPARSTAITALLKMYHKAKRMGKMKQHVKKAVLSETLHNRIPIIFVLHSSLVHTTHVCGKWMLEVGYRL